MILFAKDTVEDPACKAQEDFVDMVEGVASRRTLLESPWTVDDLKRALELRP